MTLSLSPLPLLHTPQAPVGATVYPSSDLLMDTGVCRGVSGHVLLRAPLVLKDGLGRTSTLVLAIVPALGPVLSPPTAASLTFSGWEQRRVCRSCLSGDLCVCVLLHLWSQGCAWPCVDVCVCLAVPLWFCISPCPRAVETLWSLSPPCPWG